MGRLSTPAPRLSHAASRLTAPTFISRSAERWATRVSRKWYNSRRWQLLRMQVLVAALFTCTRCGRCEADTSQLVADHKIPHRDDQDLFWARSNLQCLCKVCHDKAKQSEERGSPWG